MAESLDQVKKKVSAFLQALGAVPLPPPKVAPAKEPPPPAPVQAEIPPAVATPVETQDPVELLEALILEAAGQLPLPAGSYSVAFAKTPEGEAVFAAKIGHIPWHPPDSVPLSFEGEGDKGGEGDKKKKPKKPSIHTLGVEYYQVAAAGGGVFTYKHPKQVLQHFKVKITDVPCRQVISWAFEHQGAAIEVKVVLKEPLDGKESGDLLWAASYVKNKSY